MRHFAQGGVTTVALDCASRKPVQGRSVGLCEAEALAAWWFGTKIT